MAKREQKRLTDAAVRAAKEPGRYGDGGNLFLVVSARESKKWTFLYRWEGRLTEMGLGSLVNVGLKAAREKAAAARALLDKRVNPLDAKRAEENARKTIPTFGSFAIELLTGAVSAADGADETKDVNADQPGGIEDGFSNAKHRQQWRNTLKTYAAPIWETPVDAVSTDDVLKCLKPIWLTKPETASRVRGRIERVLNAAKARRLRSGENPAAWRGHLDMLLSRPKKLSRGHHAALPYEQMHLFMTELRAREAVAALALEFLILTASRMSEVLGARWQEIDIAQKIWTVPADRMKARKEHRVPLGERAMAIVLEMEETRTGEYVFPGQGKVASAQPQGDASEAKNKPLSLGAFDALLERMKRSDITAHGFRSAFSDWASEASPFSAETRESALAHTIGNKAEAAYRRGDALEKRRLMMEAWAQWCEPRAADNVVSIRRAERS